MEEINFEKVFEDLKTIKSNVVPKSQYEEAQLEIERLKSLLQDAYGQVKTLADDLVAVRAKANALETEKEELNKNLKMANLESGLILKEFEKLKAQHEEDKLKVDLIEAENKRLQVSFQSWKANNDVLTWRLKLKSHQLDSLNANIQKNDSPEKLHCSIGTQTIKEEPESIGVVNVPASCSSRKMDVPKSSTTATTTQSKLETRKSLNAKPQVGAKRKSFQPSNQERRKSQRIIPKSFVCETCIYDWGKEFEFQRGFSHENLPNPIDHISTFLSSRELRLHMAEKHNYVEVYHGSICADKNCLQFNNRKRPEYNCISQFPHGDIVCDTCKVTYKFEEDLNRHVQLVHSNDNFRKVYTKFRLTENKICLMELHEFERLT